MDWSSFIGMMLGVAIYHILARKYLIRLAKEDLLRLLIKEDLVFIIENHSKLKDADDAN